MKRISTVGPKSCPVGSGCYLRPVQFLDHLTVIIIQNEVGLGGSPTIKVTLILQNMYLFTVDLQGRINWGYAAMT